MRFSRHDAFKALVVSSIFTLLPLVSANPYPRPDSEPRNEVANVLEKKACAVTCGYYGQLCCQQGEYCYTDTAGQAQCGSGAQGAGGENGHTTLDPVPQANKTATVITSAAPAAAATAVAPAAVTVTVTVGYAVGSSPAAQPAQQCNYQLGQTQCGVVCCAQGSFCNSGVCVANGATTAAGGYYGQSTITAAIRPTSISTFTVITTGGVTTTVGFMAPASATGSFTAASTGSSLSGGAIAGIVIGVLVGIALLILLIICCCARGLLDLFRPKRKTEVTEIYESHHHSGGGGPPKRRFGIFPIGGGGGEVRKEKEGRGWLGVAGVLAALAVILGLKRRHDRREEEEKSTAYTYSDYTYSYTGTSASSASSDRRSRRSGMTRSDMRGSRR